MAFLNFQGDELTNYLYNNSTPDKQNLLTKLFIPMPEKKSKIRSGQEEEGFLRRERANKSLPTLFFFFVGDWGMV